MVRGFRYLLLEFGEYKICYQIYYLIFGALPYSWWGYNALAGAMIGVLGELPPEWESKWEQMRSDVVTRENPGAGERETAFGLATGETVS